MSEQYENIEQIDTIDDDNKSTINSNKRNLFQKIIDNHYVPFICLFIVSVSIGIGTPIIWNKIWRPTLYINVESDLRYDCSPLRPLKQKSKKIDCNSNICLWDNFSKENEISCYYKMERDEDIVQHSHFMPRYIIVNQTDPFNYILKMKTKPPFISNILNNDLTEDPVIQHKLTLSIKHYNKKHFSVLIKPEHESEKLWSKHFDFNYVKHNNSIVSDAKIFVRNNIEKNYFQLKIKRRSNGANIFHMGFHSPFIFANGYIEITVLFIKDQDLLYGLGQSNQPFRHNFSIPSKWKLFNQYHENVTENSTSLFGSHPFYLGIDDPYKGNAYGVLLLNTFPIEAITNARPSLTLRTIGGHLEFHYFLGPTPAEVIQQLLNFIHKPAMPPYWALGFHMCHTQCSLPQWDETVAKLHNLSVPIESDCGTSLQISNDKFENFIKKLHSENMKWISAISPHLISSSGRLDDIWKSNVLLQHMDHKPYSGTITGCDSNEDVPLDQTSFYPDFFNEKTSNLYVNNSKLLNNKADGFILDLNTPVNLANSNHSCLKMLKRYKWNYYYFAQLNEKNPCLDSWFSNSNLFNYERIIGPYIALHNIYGMKHTKAVFEKFKHTKKRPFIMSLSTFIGSGRYGGHIGTAINGTWSMLRFSLKQILDFSLFGIPMVGFPVGGYKGEKRSKNNYLIRQWYHLASMQPFMIAYSGLDEINTPFIDSMENTLRSAIKRRYQILPYLYTLFYKATTEGHLVAQPLFFQFPKDKYSYKVEQQYMLGSALMIAPLLEEDKSSINVYFPNGRWYDFDRGNIVWNKKSGTEEIPTINIHSFLRGGQIVATQDSERNIKETRLKHGFNVIVGYDQNYNATGELYIDNGNNPMPENQFIKVFFMAQYNNITINIEKHGRFCQAMNLGLVDRFNTTLESIKLYGIIDQPNQTVRIYSTDRHGYLKKHEPEFVNEINYYSKFGIFHIKTNLDLCKGFVDRPTHTYFLNWTYVNWELM